MKHSVMFAMFYLAVVVVNGEDVGIAWQSYSSAGVHAGRVRWGYLVA